MPEQPDTETLKDAVRAVLDSKRQEAIDTRATRDAATRRANRQTPLVLMMILMWGILGYVWIARPPAIFAPQSARRMTTAQTEAHARFALYLERSRIETFRQANGKLPTVLIDAGPVEDGVRYFPVGAGYALERDANGATLRLTNSMATDSFLGRSLQILRNRR